MVDLLFNELVSSYVVRPHYIERPWLVAEVEAALDDPNCRFLLLTAEPGAGKTAFLAGLAHEHPEWPRYFLRRDQRTPLCDVGALSFFLTIGYQLAATHPKLFTQEQVRRAVDQRLGSVGESGEAAGAEVRRLLASPFYQNVLQIRQHVERSAGAIAGLKVDELVIEPRLFSEDDLQNMTLFDPARALQATSPEEQIVILVDALDEIRWHGAKGSLLEWLTHCHEIPINVRFLLTSRSPDRGIRLFMEKQKPYLRQFKLERKDKRVKADLRTFVKSWIEIAQVSSILQGREGGVGGFVEEVVAKADGNLGYLDALVRAVDHSIAMEDAESLEALLALEESHQHSRGLYAFFMRQIKESVFEQLVRVHDPVTDKSVVLSVWDEVYWPLLMVLAVARGPLSLEQIVRFSGSVAGRGYFEGALDALSQFVDRPTEGYRLYHESLADFLTSEQTLESYPDLYCNPIRAHRMICNSVLAELPGGTRGQ